MASGRALDRRVLPIKVQFLRLCGGDSTHLDPAPRNDRMFISPCKHEGNEPWRLSSGRLGAAFWMFWHAQ